MGKKIAAKMRSLRQLLNQDCFHFQKTKIFILQSKTFGRNKTAFTSRHNKHQKNIKKFHNEILSHNAQSSV